MTLGNQGVKQDEGRSLVAVSEAMVARLDWTKAAAFSRSADSSHNRGELLLTRREEDLERPQGRRT